MPIVNGRYIGDSKQDIKDAMFATIQGNYNGELNPDEVGAIIELLDPYADILSIFESEMREILDNAHLRHAEDEALDYLVELINVTRRPAIQANGQLEFSFADGEHPGYDVSIPEGLTVQNNGEVPTRYETVERGTIRYLDGFEDNDIAEYSGDTGTTTFSLSSLHPSKGSYELAAGATSGDHIFNNNVTLPEAFTMEVDVYPEASTVPIVTFGVQDNSNYYQAVVDVPNGQLRIEKVEAGSVTQTIDSIAASPTTGAYNTLEIERDVDGTITVTHEGIEAQGEDTDAEVYDTGAYGFKSGDATASKYWDEAKTTAVTLHSEAVEAGDEGNIGQERINLFFDSPPHNDLQVTNPNAITGGKDRETDEELRERAQESVSEGAAATAGAILQELRQLPEMDSVTLYVNDTTSSNGNGYGLPAQTIEPLIVWNGEDYQPIWDAIGRVKAAGEPTVNGYNGNAKSGTYVLDNGQEFTIKISEPTEIDIHIDASVEYIADNFAGTKAIKEEIVEYIGGYDPDGELLNGDLDAGNDVIYGEIEFAIRSIPGVYEVTDLQVATTDPPSGTTNIAIADSEVAKTDARASTTNISVSTTEIDGPK